MISLVSIRNFRSIASADIAAERLTTLVGANDAGKSNVLRALNLFFNGETNPGEPFSFARDFNQFAEARSRKAPQLEIRIRFRLPGSYQRDDIPKEIEWKKVWRREGEVQRMETRTFVGGDEFPARSKIPALLDRIHFTYVPAIKDKAFFADLQGRLYDVLASVAEEPLKESAGAFQSQLGEQLQGLLKQLQAAFGAEATMRLPDNLREIFENLEINSGEVPLSRRGDGIKIRHIPMLLRFISEKRDELLTRGGVRYSHIWGFEEPENNVEMSSAFKMGGEFADLIAQTDHFQLFLTTHSPIFYRLDQQRPEAANVLVSHFVSKTGHETTIDTRRPDEVDESMGLMPIVAPYIAKAKERYDQLNSELANIKDLAAQKRPTIFVEGDTDRRVIAKAWDLLSGIPSNQVNICCNSEGYGGANALTSRSLAWLLTMRHKATEDRVKAAALFDGDEIGKEQRKYLTEEVARLKLHTYGLRPFEVPMPQRLVPLARAGFRVSADLEACYSDKLWTYAERQQWLEPVKLHKVLSEQMVSVLAEGGENPFHTLSPSDAIRLKQRFSDRGKDKAARRMEQLKDDEALKELAGFENLIVSLRTHLGFPDPKIDVAQQ